MIVRAMNALSTTSARWARDPRTQQSLHHSVRDGIAHSVMTGAGETYFAAYALFLGASDACVSLLAALPPLVGAGAQLGAARLARPTDRRRFLSASAVVQALTWLPILWLPYAFPAYAVPMLLGCLVLYYAAVGFGAPLWSSLMAELVPAHLRGRFFGRRNQYMHLANFLALVGAGLTLQYFEARDNARLAFALIFGTAAGARLCSAYYLSRMCEPDRPSGPVAAEAETAFFPHPRLLRFSCFAAAVMGAVGVSAPFFALYMLKELGMTYFELTLATAAFVVAQFVSLRAWGRLGDLYGNRTLLVVTGAALPLLPLPWLLAPGLGAVLLLQAAAGWIWAGFRLALGNYFFDLMPGGPRPHDWALHNFLGALGTAAGALLGGTLAGKGGFAALGLGLPLRGIAAALTASAMLRAVVLLAFLPRVRETRPVRAFSARIFLVAMLRFNHLGAIVCRWSRRLARRDGAEHDRLDA
ncbi:MAG TPA: MFS transporter [Burkholderiales bacterium]